MHAHRRAETQAGTPAVAVGQSTRILQSLGLGMSCSIYQHACSLLRSVSCIWVCALLIDMPRCQICASGTHLLLYKPRRTHILLQCIKAGCEPGSEWNLKAVHVGSTPFIISSESLTVKLKSATESSIGGGQGCSRILLACAGRAARQHASSTASDIAIALAGLDMWSAAEGGFDPMSGWRVQVLHNTHTRLCALILLGGRLRWYDGAHNCRCQRRRNCIEAWFM